jgi:hypothetical protein
MVEKTVSYLNIISKRGGLSMECNESEVCEEEVMQEEVMQEEVMQEEVMQEEVMQEEVMQEEVMQEEVMQEEVMQEEVMQEEVMQEEVQEEESTTYSSEDLLKSFEKAKIDIGRDYHLTEDELHKICEESGENREEIRRQMDEIYEVLCNDSVKVDISKLSKDHDRLEQLYTIEHSLIKAAATELMKYSDPVDYIIKVYNRLHIGDTGIGKVLLLSIACQSVLNSEGLQPKLSGSSGKGKTHAAKTMLHLIPGVGYKLEGSLSAKSLFYHPDLQAGTVVFSDDVRINDDLEDTLKRSMTNFQQKTHHMTVINGKPKTLEIPERITWWMTSVDNPFSDELLNRLFGLDVDDSADQDSAVTQQQLNQAKYGEVAFPDNEKDIQICRAIIHMVKSKIFKVSIPYADRIVWKGSGDRRNLPRFLDLIKAFAVLRFMQRIEFLDNEILADVKDFEDAKALYEQGKAGLTTKLTEAELRLVKYMVGKSAFSINQIVKDYTKPNGSPYTPEAIRKLLEGKKGGKGLVDKVPGMLVHGSGGKGDEKKYEIPSFDDNSALEIVTLKPDPNRPIFQESVSIVGTIQ